MISGGSISIGGSTKCNPTAPAPKKGLAGTGIGLEGAAMLPEVGAIGIHGLPPPAAIGEAGDAGIVGAGQLQAEASPAQHDEGPWHGATLAIGNHAGIDGTVVEGRLQGIAIAQVALWHGRRPGRWGGQEHQQGHNEGEEANHGVGGAIAMMARWPWFSFTTAVARSAASSPSPRSSREEYPCWSSAMAGPITPCGLT